MAESRKRTGLFGSYTEHTDDHGNKVGESRDKDGLFGSYTEHVDDHGRKSGESREREGLFGTYTEHVDDRGRKVGESRERDGLFGAYTEHVDAHGTTIGESREREGLFGTYTEHTRKGRVEVEEDEEEESASSILGMWVVKGLALLFAVLLVIASWPIWLGMLLITLAVSAALALSLTNGGWAVNVNERLGGRSHMLGPSAAILIASIVVFAAGFGGRSTGDRILLGIVIVGSGIVCWRVAGWVFDFVMTRAARKA